MSIAIVEEAMRLALAEHEVRRKSPEGGMSQEDIAKFSRKLQKRDFGSLSQILCQKLKLSKEWLEILKQAKDLRNHMAHDYWMGQIGNAQSERGLKIITRQCNSLTAHMVLLADRLVSLTGINLQAYLDFTASAADDDDTYREWERLLTKAEQAVEEAQASG